MVALRNCLSSLSSFLMRLFFTAFFHSHIGDAEISCSPASWNSRGVRVPFSKNWDSVGVFLNAVPTFCTTLLAVFLILSNIDIVMLNCVL